MRTFQAQAHLPIVFILFAKRRHFLKKLLLSVIIGLVLVIVYLSVSFRQHSNVAGLGPAIQTPMGDITIGMPQFPNMNFGSLAQPITVLFMGVDVQYSGQGRSLIADKSALNGRSDTMMLVFLNPLLNKISVLNIPRDTEANIGKFGVQKINAANALGGPEYAKAAVTNLLGIGIDHYVVMNLQGLVQLVNELGGVTVEVPKKMSYMDWTAKLKIDLDPGWHTLTGNQAMGFVRFRHDDLGDIGRVQRQQVFLQAAERKMLDPRSWVHVPSLIDIATKNMQTDMSQMDLFQACNFAHNVPKSNIKFVMLPGQFSGNGDWIATSDARTLAFQLLNPDQEIVSSRRNLTVCIKNASSDKTLGSKLALALRKLGYQTSIGKDEKDSIYKRSRIIVQNGNVANGNMVQNDLGHVGEVISASVGDLYSKITILACDDINLDLITMSSVDAPYVVPVAATPIIAPMHVITKTHHSSGPSASETVINEPTVGVDPGAQQGAPVPDGAGTNPEKYSDSNNEIGSGQTAQPAIIPETETKPVNSAPNSYAPPASVARPAISEPVVPSAPVPGVQDQKEESNSNAGSSR
jgi:LCP family protein required for cell wall assembly